MHYLSHWPADCLLLIADQLSKYGSLSSLARTSKRMYLLLNPHLFRRAVKSRGATAALWWAIRIGNLTETRFALEAGAYLDAKEDEVSRHGYCVASEALKSRYHMSQLWNNRKYFGWKVDPRVVDSRLDDYRPLILLLLDSDADIHGRDGRGWMSLHQAAWLSDEEMVRVLVETGADITLPSDEGTTPLHLAAFRGHVEAIRFLLERGADINGCKKFPSTPFPHAAREGFHEATAFLLEKGYEVDAIDWGEQTPLHSVVWSGACRPIEDIIQLLIDKGAEIEAVDAKGMTSLQKAVAFGYSIEVIDCLVANRAKVEVRDLDGRNLPQLGWKHRNYSIAERFARRSAQSTNRASR
ncbi:hypothetical protein N7481_008654 [Penicillium waksmanii]|uniref:uncharacterized protein n=1 Tax=Penicillium waksmanii TaxID=69791 RepID=UPI002548ABEC|nr:uncharacterized protein N7481_008654 [Penicillium waksmanii]KAJ5974947.1 hypothetical protein N7481_008654 [Penicillium waksmanii]